MALARLRGDVRPQRRTRKSEPRRRMVRRRAALEPAVPQHAGHQREVADAAGEHPDRVERAGQWLDAVARERAERRLVAQHAAIGRGSVDRAGGLGAGGQRDRARGDAGGRAARGAAGRARAVERVERVGWRHPGELRAFDLAGDKGARAAQAGDRRGVDVRVCSGIDPGSVLGGQVLRVEVVLDRDRHSEQRKRVASGRGQPIEGRGRGSHKFRIERRPDVEIVASDRGQERIGDLDAGELVGGQPGPDLHRVDPVEQLRWPNGRADAHRTRSSARGAAARILFHPAARGSIPTIGRAFHNVTGPAHIWRGIGTNDV